MSQNRAQSTDAIPFSGLPVARLQPEHLEIIARLRGMQPAAAARARVLELSCGVGQNLLPLAERYPEASFLGIDRSAGSIEAAQQAAGELALQNVELRQRDILELDSQLGTFDYIIANGVYSWVDAPVRDKLLAVCRDHLAPQGIAYVSYKTYPGWHVRDMFRAMMRYDGRDAATSSEKSARAQIFLEFLEVSLAEDHPYDKLVHGEVAELRKESSDYLWNDYLQDFSHPVYFPEFVEHAQAYSLQVAGDAAVGLGLWDSLEPEIERQLGAITEDHAQRELFRDVVRNRTARQSLLCHAAISLTGSVTPDLLKGMYLEGSLRPGRVDVDLSPSGVEQFLTAGGLHISTSQPLIKAALLHLGETWPDYVLHEDLLAAGRARIEAAGHPAPTSPDAIKRFEANLVQCCTGEVVALHSHPPSFLSHPTEAPAASPVARAQARRGELVCNRRHEVVRLDTFDRHLIELLDGTRDRSQLIAQLAAAAAEGRLIVMEHQRQVQNFEDAKRVFGIALPEALARLARSALLIG